AVAGDRPEAHALEHRRHRRRVGRGVFDELESVGAHGVVPGGELHEALLCASMQRVPLADFEPALRKRLEELWGEPPNLYKALGNHPKLIAAWAEFSKTLRYDTRTPRALRELVILRGAQLMRSEYEWAQHLKMARKAGISDAQIQALSSWKSSNLFDAREKAALGLAEAVTQGKVSDEVY